MVDKTHGESRVDNDEKAVAIREQHKRATQSKLRIRALYDASGDACCCNECYYRSSFETNAGPGDFVAPSWPASS